MEDMTMAKNKDHNLVQRGDTWYLQKVVNGRRLKKALSKSVTEARRLRDQFLQEIAQHGRIVDKADTAPHQVLFGEVAQSWAKITPKRVKKCTFRDYRSAMNYYILDRFGNLPISDISFLDIEEFLAELECSNKRKNNVLVPMRGVFKLAMRAGYIEKDPMELVRNLKTQKPDIAPLSMDEVRKFLDIVSPRYRDFFSVAFFSGMRFGEMSALKWKNVDFKLGVIRVRETRVDGEEGCPKTRRLGPGHQDSSPGGRGIEKPTQSHHGEVAVRVSQLLRPAAISPLGEHPRVEAGAEKDRPLPAPPHPDAPHLCHIDAGCRRAAWLGGPNDGPRQPENDPRTLLQLHQKLPAG
jgi:hypothetical protein